MMRHTGPLSRASRLRRATLITALALCFAACQTPAGDAQDDTTLDPTAERGVLRLSLENGRALRTEGRYDAAERVLRRGLAVDPQNAKLERELAHALEAQDRADEARAARARADAIDPPPPPLPEDRSPTAEGRSLVVLLESTGERRIEEPGSWPDARVSRVLESRIATRLPGTELLRADPESVADARRWLADQDSVRALSLRVDRADCRFSVKDGDIAVVELRVAAAARGATTPPPSRVKVVLEDSDPETCVEQAIGRAFEGALATPAWQGVANREGLSAASAWTDTQARPLFAGLDRRIERELMRGRALLHAGQLEEARRAFEVAARIDPKDPNVRDHLEDTERSLALAKEIAARSPGASDPGSVDPRLSPSQRAAAEVALEREHQRRGELLVALAVLDEDLRAPPMATLENLRVVEIRAPDAFGPTLARQRAGGRIEARAAYAPDGAVIARYYFAADTRDPVVREEDTNGDGHSDRWIAYQDAARSEIFEDTSGRGHPDRRLLFAKGGEPLERVELDQSGDDRPERVFRYADGRLLVEEVDTNSDGRLDRFDHFDANGNVERRDEDIDGDGRVDQRSHFSRGRLIRREVFGADER